MYPVRQLLFRLPPRRHSRQVLSRVCCAGAPAGFQSMPINARGFPETRYVLQVYPDDCTGCNLCVDACPVRNELGEGEVTARSG